MTAASDAIRRHRLFILILLVIAAAAFVAGGGAAIGTGLLALPVMAWRYDNQTGVFLPLSILLLIVFGILAALLGLIAIVHR